MTAPLAVDTWITVGLAGVNLLQVLGLAWLAAWQQRAASEVRKLNGHAEELRAALEGRLSLVE